MGRKSWSYFYKQNIRLRHTFQKNLIFTTNLYEPSITMLRKILRWLLAILLPIALFVAGVLIFPKVKEQQTLVPSTRTPIRQIDSLFYAQRIEAYKEEFGKKKVLLPGYELQTLLALSYYPELREVEINFLYEKAFIPLSSRPYFPTMFGKRDKWVYNVIVSSESIKSMETILLKNLPFNAQVGILAHEIGHTLHYQQYGFWQMLKFALLYAFDADFRATHERSTDAQVVYHSLGWQLFDYAKFVRTDPSTLESYESSKGFIDKFYLTPADIMQVMSEMPNYGSPTPDTPPAPY